MRHEINLITDALEKALQGEPEQSFQKPEFAELIKAVNLVSKQPFGCEVVGRHLLGMVLQRLSASMHTEREIAILRDNSKPLC